MTAHVQTLAIVWLPTHADCQRSSRPRDRSGDAGGGERARTDDLLLAKQALSQLSYTPVEIEEPPDQNFERSGGPGWN